MNIQHLSTIIDLCHKLAYGQASTLDIAQALDEPPRIIRQLLTWNHVINIRGDIEKKITGQDVLNVIMLYYSMKPYHQFVETSLLIKGTYQRATPAHDQ